MRRCWSQPPVENCDQRFRLLVCTTGPPNPHRLPPVASAPPRRSQDRARRPLSVPRLDVAAMANTRGGVLIYGVTDQDTKPVGIDPGEVND